MMKRAVVSGIAVAVLSAGVVGCETKAGTGALIGGAAGAGLGAIIGNNTGHGHTAGGAAIGGVAGALGGALIGNELDKKDREEATARQRDSYRDRDYNRTSSYPAADYDRDPYANHRSNNAAANAVTKADVIEWTRRGDRDDLIIDRIERSGTVFHLSSRDENQLRDAGVGEEVIRAMKDTARR
jgi:uncharacterized protein YcfJ